MQYALSATGNIQKIVLQDWVKEGKIAPEVGTRKAPADAR